MKKNSTLLFIINDCNNYNFLADLGELFDVSLTEKISDEFKKLECPPPDRLIKNILSKVY